MGSDLASDTLEPTRKTLHSGTEFPITTESMAMILVVDDDPQTRVWLRSLLEASGYQVEEADNAYAALAYLERAKPALVVLDIFLPKVDGLDIIMHIRSSAKPAKILGISMNQIPGYDVCRTAKVLGADEALAKPFSAETFLNHVEALLPHPS